MKKSIIWIRGNCKTPSTCKIALLASLAAIPTRLFSRVWSRRNGTSEHAGSGKEQHNHRFFRCWELCSCLVLLFFFGCAPNSSEEFQQEGETCCRLLAIDLQKIENREQLLLAEMKLKKHFEALIDLIIEAREFQQKKVEDVFNDTSFRENSAEAMLENELRRIYTIEGGREVIEKTQQEALVRLDAYERALAKKREQLKN